MHVLNCKTKFADLHLKHSIVYKISSFSFALLSLFQTLDAWFRCPLSSSKQLLYKTFLLYTPEFLTTHLYENYSLLKKLRKLSQNRPCNFDSLMQAQNRYLVKQSTLERRGNLNQPRISLVLVTLDKVTLTEYFGGNSSLSFWQRNCIRHRKIHPSALLRGGGVQVSVWIRI